MNEPLCFPIDDEHSAQQLNLVRDRAAVADLGGRCFEYIRSTSYEPVRPNNAGRVLLAMLQPACVPIEQSVVFGIFSRPCAENGAAESSPRLVGVLYVLHPRLRGDTWFITLLLLDPAVRGRGLGAATHRVFRSWAAARGATRFVIAVSEQNPRAWHFWRDQLGYYEAESIPWKYVGAKRRHRELELRFGSAPALPAWAASFAVSRY